MAAPTVAAALTRTANVCDACVKASERFRAGVSLLVPTLPADGLAFQPETSCTYEAEARMECLDHRLRVIPTFILHDWRTFRSEAFHACGLAYLCAPRAMAT